jgi:acetyl-CoA carboxylase biotin carboxyl carrier protein
VASNAKKNGPFDVKTVESLIALMTQHDLSEIYLRDGQQHLRLRRGATGSVVVPAAVPLPTTLPVASPSPLAKSAETQPESAPASKKKLIDIKSETVGTYYAQPKPGERPYVKLGDRVTPDTVVGLVEVMKTYNELQAGCSGILVEILVEDSQSVEFGQVLFRVDPS